MKTGEQPAAGFTLIDFLVIVAVLVLLAALIELPTSIEHPKVRPWTFEVEC
jgi:hypothetical protein